MASDWLNLWNTGSQTQAVSATYWNDVVNAIDRVGEAIWNARLQGPLSGWALPETSTVSQINRGYGFIGPQFCETAASTTISGIAVGTNYVHVVTTTSSGWAGAIEAKARTTSAALTNADGTSEGIILGTIVAAANTGVTESSVDSSLRQPAFQLRGHHQTVAISITAAATTVVSTAYAFSTAMRFPSLSALQSIGGSQFVKVHTLTESGFVATLYNNNSNAATTYSKNSEWRGFLL